MTRPRRWRAHPDGLCSVQGCARPHHSLGLCGTHATRLRRTGTTGTPSPEEALTRLRALGSSFEAVNTASNRGAVLCERGRKREVIARRVWTCLTAMGLVRRGRGHAWTT